MKTLKLSFRRYMLYLIRWQLSTPILAIVLILLATWGKLWATVIANLIGGLIFFWVDRFIFTSKCLQPQWEIQDNILCGDCGKTARGYRLVKTKNYDKLKSEPVFRCELCSQRKTESLRKEGVAV